MKKVFSLLFIFIILSLSVCIPTAADEAVTEISNADELVAFFENAGSGVLTADIVLNGQFDVYTDISLDFNGHIISANDTSQYAAIIFHSETQVVLFDSKGKGGIYDDDDYISITVEDEVDFTVESGRYDDITANGGTINLIGGEVIQFGFDEVWPLRINWQNTEVGTWHIGCCKSINKLPNQKLTVGFESVKNDDGTYNVQYYTVDKLGETLTVYYDAFLNEVGAYQLTEDGTAPKNISLKILYVNNGEPEIIPMKCVDKEGRLWKCEFDKAYIGAEIFFINEDADFTSYKTNLPDRSNMTYNAEKLWYGPRLNMTWFIVGGVALAVIAAAVILIVIFSDKRKE